MAQNKVRLKLNAYPIVSDCIESAIPAGIRRYYKHRSEKQPKDIDAMVEEIHNYIMCALVDLIDWDSSV